MKFASLHDAMKDYATDAGVENIEDLSEAILDGHVIPELGDLSFLSKFENFGYLSLNKCDISKLPNFPKGLGIERLEICDNKISGGLEGLANLEKLEELHLGGNAIETLDQLKPLASLSNLRILDLTDCPVSKSETIHEEVFKLIPSLEAFNGKDQSGESVDFEDDSADLDDYSDEDSEDESGSDEDDEDDGEDFDDEDDDEDDEEEGEEDDELVQKPPKSARHE